MSDRRIERALRAGPPDEPEWRPGRFSRRGGVRPRGSLGSWSALALIAVVAFIGGAMLTRHELQAPASAGGSPGASAHTAPGRSDAGPAGGDLLQRVRSSGVLRVGIATDPPQTKLSDGEIIGFDVDIGTAIATRLGVRLALVPTTRAALDAGSWSTDWDVAVSSIVVTSKRRETLDFSAAYAYRPVTLSVVPGSGIGSVSDLAGRTVCVAAGGVPEDWLLGRVDIVSPVAIPPVPDGVRIVQRSVEQECFQHADFLGQDADLTDRLGPTELAAQTRARPLPRAVFWESMAVALDRAGPDSDAMRAELDRIIDGLRTDGTLARASIGAFGQDLTAVPAG